MKMTKARDRQFFWLSLGLALGWLSGLFLSHRQPRGARRIAQLDAWEGALAEKYGPQKAALLVAKVQAGYEDLYSSRPRFHHPALRSHLESHILPGLALYQVLKEDAPGQGAALADLDRCFTAHVQTSSHARQVKLLSRLPGAFSWLRLANRIILRTQYPAQGWQIEWVEDSPCCIAYDITSCFYLNVLEAYGAPELTAHFCALDDQLYSGLPGIHFDRSQTLGRGGHRNHFSRKRYQLSIQTCEPLL